VLVVHEDCITGGIGAEIAAWIGSTAFPYLDAPWPRGQPGHGRTVCACIRAEFLTKVPDGGKDKKTAGFLIYLASLSDRITQFFPFRKGSFFEMITERV
jgi:hypothetical protein